MPPIEKSADRILNALGYTEAELSIAIVDDTRMAELNLEYRGVDETTDVLSFSMTEGEFGDICPEMLGDVVISAPMAQSMSREHSCSLQTVLDLLLVHGILHLVGHDHAEGGEGARRMFETSVELMKSLEHSEQSFAWYRDTDLQ